MDNSELTSQRIERARAIADAVSIEKAGSLPLSKYLAEEHLPGVYLKTRSHPQYT